MPKPPKLPKPTAPPPLNLLADQYRQSKRVGGAQLRALGNITAIFGHLTADEITPAQVQAYRKVRDAGDSTQRRELGALVAVLNWAARTRLILPASVPHIDLPPAKQPRDVWMTAAQARRFREGALASGNPRVAAFVCLALATGARKEAILRLTWDRVDLDLAEIDFREPGTTLTKKRRVKVPIDMTTRDVLAALDPCRIDLSPFVVGQGSIRRGYEQFAESVGMPWVTPHVMRHTAATLMLQAGIPVWDVAGILGDSPETVTRVYGHHSTKHLRSAATVLGRVLSSGNQA